jgi:hypothetical protein
MRSVLLYSFMCSFLVLFFSGCILDDSGPPAPQDAPDCIDLPPPPKPLDVWPTVFPDYLDLAVCWNPHDPNEIVFSRDYLGGQSDTLFRYNLLTTQLQYVTSLGATSLEWGYNDWILIDAGGISKVKANGDSLTSINLPGIPSKISIDPSGERFAVFILDGSNSGFRVADLEGNFLDTIQEVAIRDWFVADTVLGFSQISGTYEFGIYTLALSTHERRLITYAPLEGASPEDALLTVKMFGDRDRIAILTWKGLWVYTKSTNEMRKLAPSCSSKRIMSVRVAPNQQHLLVEENGFSIRNASSVENHYAVVLLDAITGERLDTLLYVSPE